MLHFCRIYFEKMLQRNVCNKNKYCDNLYGFICQIYYSILILVHFAGLNMHRLLYSAVEAEACIGFVLIIEVLKVSISYNHQLIILVALPINLLKVY